MSVCWPTDSSNRMIDNMEVHVIWWARCVIDTRDQTLDQIWDQKYDVRLASLNLFELTRIWIRIRIEEDCWFHCDCYEKNELSKRNMGNLIATLSHHIQIQCSPIRMCVLCLAWIYPFQLIELRNWLSSITYISNSIFSRVFITSAPHWIEIVIFPRPTVSPYHHIIIYWMMRWIQQDQK